MHVGRTGRWGLAALAGAVLSLAGCSSESDPGLEGSTDEIRVAVYEPAGPGGDSALLAGIVETSGDCVVVKVSDGSIHTPVFNRTQIRVTGREFSYGGKTFKEGDTISLGGGYTTESDLPAGCPSAAFTVGPPPVA